MILDVKVTPYSSKNEILRWEENRLVLKIQGVPEKGKVNENLIAFLAHTLKISKSNIHILSGETSLLKKLHIEGITLDAAKTILSQNF